MKLSELPVKEQTVLNLALLFDRMYGKGNVYIRYIEMYHTHFFTEHNLRTGKNGALLTTWCKVSRNIINSMLSKGLIVGCDTQHNVNVKENAYKNRTDGVKFLGYMVLTENVEYDNLMQKQMYMDITSLTNSQREVIKQARQLEQIAGIGTVFLIYKEKQQCYEYIQHKVGEIAYTRWGGYVTEEIVQAMLKLGLLIHCNRNHKILKSATKDEEYIGLRICTECVVW